MNNRRNNEPWESGLAAIFSGVLLFAMVAAMVLLAAIYGFSYRPPTGEGETETASAFESNPVSVEIADATVEAPGDGAQAELPWEYYGDGIPPALAYPDFTPYQIYNARHEGRATCDWVGFCSLCKATQCETGKGEQETETEHEMRVTQVCEVLNRVEDTSKEFPNTVTDVISQKGQYSQDYITDSLDGITLETIDLVSEIMMMDTRPVPLGVVSHASHGAWHNLPVYKTFSGETWAGYKFQITYFSKNW